MSMIIPSVFAVVCAYWALTDFRDGDWVVGSIGALISLINVAAALTAV